MKSKQDTATAFLAALQSTKSPTTLDVDGTEYADSVGNEAAIEFNKKEEREILVDKDSSNAASTRKVGEWSASGIRGIREVVTSTESSFLSFTKSKIAETLATLDFGGTEYADSVENEALELNKKEESTFFADKDSSDAARSRTVGERSATGIRGQQRSRDIHRKFIFIVHQKQNCRNFGCMETNR